MFCILRNEENSDTCTATWPNLKDDEATSGLLVRERQRLHESTCMWCSGTRKSHGGCQGLRGGRDWQLLFNGSILGFAR